MKSVTKKNKIKKDLIKMADSNSFTSHFIELTIKTFKFINIYFYSIYNFIYFCRTNL